MFVGHRSPPSLAYLQTRMLRLLTASVHPDTEMDEMASAVLLAVCYRYLLSAWLASHRRAPTERIRQRLASIATGEVAVLAESLHMLQSGLLPETLFETILAAPAVNLVYVYHGSVMDKAKRIHLSPDGPEMKKALALWDRLMPDHRGLLDAESVHARG